ncbi:TlpA family protein disulfide reductase [Propionivibrio sp.]|uniref:TlpA family protein disulfide reductase n=1 Tax=Propionivibrio sp. TaxID=2212460 RepID=UPI003BF09D31
MLPLLAALALTACGGDDPTRLNTGDAAPAFTTTSLGSASVKFPDDLRGKVVVIRFWADWCRYCENEMKAIERVWQRHKGEGLEVLAVNAGQSKAEVEAFIRKIGVTYPALLDEQAVISKKYGVLALPTTYFVGKDGTIRAKVIGEADEATFERVAMELLK